MKSVHWEAPARLEYEEALASSSTPNKFQETIIAAIEAIASGRVTHAEVRGTNARRCVLTKLPYSIIYMETDEEVRIWAFPHHKRKPGYWKNRLPSA